jgi:hypothetical protein
LSIASAMTVQVGVVSLPVKGHDQVEVPLSL